ncbi:hypothetical protein MCOR25_000663 [Pyricularia grisea]|uniref:ATP synthase F0 n=1 Tax=Pyricularia grisea TaxID=148305 RepID=A0A6P8BBQ6_PYRGI|nr:uncharacterized protein PgNI_04051 [Pyricularia grisea]KAI6382364.1 hypothetical protein MCOR25_000663 [Pyricularia grisea]TLD13229.1 hypothetical protein PgNI_04051 [Pyricularia grisea]
MDRLSNINPFSKRDSHSANAVITYKILTITSWLLSLLSSVYYTFNDDHDAFHIRRRIWDINDLYLTGFRLDHMITSLYWLALFILQVGYASFLFSTNLDRKNQACAVGSHFILNNLLHFAFVMLFVYGHFVWAEVVLIVNFANLTFLYFRHNTYPRFIHTPVVSGPLAWTFVAIYWNGAIMVHHPESLVARIFANIFIWSIFVYGLFFLVMYKDYTMGFSLSVLAASLGVAQFLRQVIALQWIFAFTIMAVLFVLSLVVAFPAWTGRESSAPPQDAERAPLLHDG